jgi:hypothetical protein
MSRNTLYDRGDQDPDGFQEEASPYVGRFGGFGPFSLSIPDREVDQQSLDEQKEKQGDDGDEQKQRIHLSRRPGCRLP